MRRTWSVVFRSISALILAAGALGAQVAVTSLADDGWYSDDTRADGTGTQPAGTNLKSLVLTDSPESGSGNPAHDADILNQITIGTATGTVPPGTWPGSVHLSIGPNGSGKSTISHRKDTLTGHGPGSSIGAAFTAEYSWMGNGPSSITASLKIGIKTADFGSTPVSTRTGENAWDKLLIYEPGNQNPGPNTLSDGLWHTQTTNWTTGRWWLVDRTVGANTIGNPMTLSALSSSGLIVSGAKTLAMEYALITAPGARITSMQFGIGSGNADGSVYVNQFRSSVYQGNATVTFGSPALVCDQNVTSNFINGSGIANGAFTVARVNGIELGLRGKLRFNASNLPEDTFNSNGDGTYTFQAGHPTGGAGYVTPNTPRWNFDWSINTNYDGSTGFTVDDLTYQIKLDFASNPGMNNLSFDPIGPNSMLAYTTPATVPFWDHSFGTNATAQGAGAEAGTLGAYNTLRATSNLVQNSWNMEFFNEAPFNGFDPDVPGRYEFSLAAFNGATEVARTAITIIVVAPITFDQNVTNAAIFGTGNVNGAFTTSRADGVEIGIRGKLRYPSLNVFNSNGDGTYTFNTGTGIGGPAGNSEWSFEWSVNTDYDGSSGLKVGNRTYRFGMDNDPGNGTNYLVFDPISAGTIIPYTVPLGPITFWDHSFGNNATLTSGGVEASDAPTYAGYLTTFNLVQNSWRPVFYQNTAPYSWNPNVPGRYDYYLAAFNGATEVGRTAIAIIATNGTTLSLEADTTQADADCNLPGVQIEIGLHVRNLATAANGYQAFLTFNPAKLTYVGAASSYTAAPFNSHVQPIATANVASGQLRLDGSTFIGSTLADARLATLVFTVSDECISTALDFDLTQPFDSELSFLGLPLATELMNSGSIVADATPPVLSPSANINVAADASLVGGCSGRVVTFATPAATDNCSVPTVACFPPSGTTFPVGTTTVTCVATDASGNTTMKTFDVTVTSTNVVTLTLKLSGQTVPSMRCIHFQTNTCAYTDIPLAFDAGGNFTGDIEIPCGTYTALCGKDEQHTKWATIPLTLSGTKWVGTGTMTLNGGDTDDDGDIDINDVTWLISQFGMLAAPASCPWNGTRDADFSNNGAIGSEDYSFLTAGWLTTSLCACVVPSTWEPRDRVEHRAYLRVHDGISKSADLNGDGWVDHLDVRRFEDAHGLPHELSDILSAATPAVR